MDKGIFILESYLNKVVVSHYSKVRPCILNDTWACVIFQVLVLKSSAHAGKRQSEGLTFHVPKLQILLSSSFHLNENLKWPCVKGVESQLGIGLHNFTRFPRDSDALSDTLSLLVINIICKFFLHHSSPFLEASPGILIKIWLPLRQLLEN